MRICFIALGTHGDVRPLIALASGLRIAGEQVTVATHRYFEKMVIAHGLTYRPIEGNPREIIDSSLGRGWIQTGTNPLLFTRHFRQIAGLIGQELMEDCYQACLGAQAIVTGLLGYFAASHVAERINVPLTAAFLQPATPSRHVPSVFFSEINAPAPARGLYNLASHVIVELIFWSFLRIAVNRARTKILGLPNLPRLHTFAQSLRNNLVLYGFSPSIVPPPADWSSRVQVTGYWFLRETSSAWKPDINLTKFLQHGSAPVYVGFGSMSSHDEEDLTEIILSALHQCGLRAILATGWGGLNASQLSDDMIMLDWVPHDWLFPRTAAIIHHGGAGTTASGFLCGIPQVIVPFFGDQPFWGQRVFELGVGPLPIPRRKLTTTRLVRALSKATSDPDMRARARAVQSSICHEDGVKTAVQMFRRAHYEESHSYD